jgi:hypothetical protein
MNEPTSRLLDVHELVDALEKRGIKTSPRTIDRLRQSGLPYWKPSNRNRYDLEVSFAYILARSKVERCPAPRRRGRPRKAA